MTTTFKQSRTWWGFSSLTDLIQQASLVYTHTGHNGTRPHILTKQPIEGCNVFELDTDRWGVTMKGISKFGKYDYETITHQTSEVDQFLKNWILYHGDKSFVNPHFLKLKLFWEKFMATRFVYEVRYFLRAKMVLYKNEKKFQRLWFQIVQSGRRPFHFSCSGNPFKTQYWFWHIGLWPLFFTKHNGAWTFGLNFLFFSVQLQCQF